MFEYPNKLNNIFDKLLNNSIKPIIIGGFVRDFLLQIESKDIDIELYGINSYSKLEEILREFGDVNSVGKSFGVCKLKIDDLDLDFSFPRVDSKIDSGHKGFEVKIDSTLDFKTATSRRDFTINAIGYDIDTQQIIDPFNGIKDLNNRVLRAVDLDKFAEDPLRVLRAIQFSSRFNLSIDKELYFTCKRMFKESALNELAQERIFIEIKKLLLKSSSPSWGLKLLKELGGFTFFTELSHLSSDNFNKTMQAIDRMSALKKSDEKSDTILMLAVLSYQFSVEQCSSFLSKLTNDKNLCSRVLSLVEHQKSISFDNFRDYDVYLLATRVNIENFILFSSAISNSLGIQKLKIRAIELDVSNTQAGAILQGRDIINLGIKPSERFSKILERAYSAQIRAIFTTKEEALLWLKKELFS